MNSNKPLICAPTEKKPNKARICDRQSEGGLFLLRKEKSLSNKKKGYKKMEKRASYHIIKSEKEIEKKSKKWTMPKNLNGFKIKVEMIC